MIYLFKFVDKRLSLKKKKKNLTISICEKINETSLMVFEWENLLSVKKKESNNIVKNWIEKCGLKEKWAEMKVINEAVNISAHIWWYVNKVIFSSRDGVKA